MRYNCIIMCFLVLFGLPFISLNSVKYNAFRFFLNYDFMLLYLCSILGYLGGKPVEEPFVMLGQLLRLYILCILYLC